MNSKIQSSLSDRSRPTASRMIVQANDFFSRGCGRCERFDTKDCSAQLWREGLLTLRQLCLDLGLVETVKWGCPCYVYQGRNIAILGALRAEFRLAFFNAALMKDPCSVLERCGPNTQHPDTIRFADAAQVLRLADTLRAYLQEAMAYAQAGIRPVKASPKLELPVEMTDALQADPALAEAFDRLTPGRQRSHVIFLNAAKKAETRRSRMTLLRDRIMAGLGAQER
jgi:uncharacterized protein YdeI (YjbR/CyaY-like superfamily)